MNSLKVLIITSKIWKRALVSLLYLGRNTSSLILVENTCEYCEIYKNGFFFFIPLLAASKMNYSSNLDRYYYSHLQIHSLFYMMVSLSFYGMKALWNRDKALLTISHSRSQCQRNQSIFLLHAWTGKYRDSRQSNDRSIFSSRSSHPEVFCKKGGYRDFVKFTGKHLCRKLY